MIRKYKNVLSVDDDDDDETFHDKPKNEVVGRDQRYTAADKQTKNEQFLDNLLFGPKKPTAPIKRAEPPVNKPPVPAPTPTPAPTPVVVPPSPPPQPKPAVVETYHAPGSINTYQTLVSVKSTVFNRPGYIRKFKKVAENYGYRERNQKNNEVDNVLRIGECYYSEIKKQQRSEFTDIEFPANYVAFVDNTKERKIGHFKDYNNWKTPKQVFKTPVFGKYIDPNDVEKGLFPSDFLASCISSLAEREQNIKRLIEEQNYTETGFYYVRINVNGVWRYVIVDQWIPVHTDGTIVATHSYADDEADLWPTLIEKAYTKVYGTYEQYSRPQSRELYLRDLTGAPVRLYLPSDPNLLKILENSLERGWIVQAAPNERILDKGLNPNLTLNLLKVNGRSLQFRNSFGSLDEKPKLNLTKEGVFEVSSDEARGFINYYLVAQVHDDYSTSTVQARHKASYYSSYSFSISSNFSGYVMVSQFDSRLFNQAENLYAQESKTKVENTNHYETSPLRVLVYRKDGDKLSYVAAGHGHSKNLDVEVNLTPGEYMLFLVLSWVDRDYDVNFSLYGTELVRFKRVYNKNNPYLIAQGLEGQALRQGSKASKNGVDEYTYLHKPSGLIVVTSANGNNKAVRHAKDFGRIKGDGLLLINEKTKYDKEADKLSAFNEKQWSVDLDIGEKYSWIIASTEPVDDNSLRTLGFK